jgi:hypothetical protein
VPGAGNVEAVEQAAPDELEEGVGFGVGRRRRGRWELSGREIVHRTERHAAAHSCLGLRDGEPAVIDPGDVQGTGRLPAEFVEQPVPEEPDGHRRQTWFPVVRELEPVDSGREPGHLATLGCPETDDESGLVALAALVPDVETWRCPYVEGVPVRAFDEGAVEVHVQLTCRVTVHVVPDPALGSGRRYAEQVPFRPPLLSRARGNRTGPGGVPRFGPITRSQCVRSPAEGHGRLVVDLDRHAYA